MSSSGDQSQSQKRGSICCTTSLMFALALVSAFLVYPFVLEHHRQSPSANHPSAIDNGLQRVSNNDANNNPLTAVYGLPATEAEVVNDLHKPSTLETVEDPNAPDPMMYFDDADTSWPRSTAKYEFMPKPDAIAHEHRICYVHVGKTAGTTMKCELGFYHRGCPPSIPRDGRTALPQGNLANYTIAIMHKNYNRCMQYADTINMFLFVVRDPFTRMQSWFTYERPLPDQPVYDKRHWQAKQELFVDCPFPTLNALGGPLGLGANSTTHCSRQAWRAITGERGFAVHNYYNFRRYLDQVLLTQQQSKRKQPPRIVVLRTEHLEADWRNIEVNVLKGPEPFMADFAFPHKNKSPKVPTEDNTGTIVDDTYVSKESTAAICRALCTEIQVYKHILLRAENLDDHDFVESMKLLAERCPWQAQNARCDKHSARN